MSEEFFEKLANRSDSKTKLEAIWNGLAVRVTARMFGGEGATLFTKEEIIALIRVGRDATIEALKEMVVGEPKSARLLHCVIPTKWTSVQLIDGDALSYDGHRGIDGEEVAILAVRLS